MTPRGLLLQKNQSIKSKKMNNSKIISPEKKLDRNKTYLKHHSEEGGDGAFQSINKIDATQITG